MITVISLWGCPPPRVHRTAANGESRCQWVSKRDARRWSSQLLEVRLRHYRSVLSYEDRELVGVTSVGGGGVTSEFSRGVLVCGWHASWQMAVLQRWHVS